MTYYYKRKTIFSEDGLVMSDYNITNIFYDTIFDTAKNNLFYY